MKPGDEVVWEFRVGKIYFRVLRRPGKYFDYFIFDRGNSVACLLYIEDLKKFLFIRQYRAGVDDFEIELPAGMCDEGEDPEDAMAREVLEETGYSPSSLLFVAHLKLSPGGYTEESDLYFAVVSGMNKLGEGGGVAEEYEEIEPVLLTYTQVLDLFSKGGFTDAKTVVALQWMMINKSSLNL